MALSSLDALDALPENARGFWLALQQIKDRANQLSEPDRAGLLELVQEWVLENDPDERRNIASAILEILGNQPIKTMRVNLDPATETKYPFAEFCGKRIKAFRSRAGLSQAQLAEKSGIPQSYISRIENAEHSPTHKTLQRIADALGVPIVELDPSQA